MSFLHFCIGCLSWNAMLRIPIRSFSPFCALIDLRVYHSWSSPLVRLPLSQSTIVDLMHLPIINAWRLNERHYGALRQGLNKQWQGASLDLEAFLV